MKLDDVEVGMIVRLNGMAEKLTILGFEKKVITKKDGSESQVVAVKCIQHLTGAEIFYPPEALMLAGDDKTSIAAWPFKGVSKS